MLNPATQDLSCWQGGTWDEEMQFWDDAQETVAHDFTGWTISMTITLPGNSTIQPTIDLTGNSLVLSLTSTQTSGFTAGAGKYILKMTDTSTPPNVEYLMHGAFTIVAP